MNDASFDNQQLREMAYACAEGQVGVPLYVIERFEKTLHDIRDTYEKRLWAITRIRNLTAVEIEMLNALAEVRENHVPMGLGEKDFAEARLTVDRVIAFILCIEPEEVDAVWRHQT